MILWTLVQVGTCNKISFKLYISLYPEAEDEDGILCVLIPDIDENYKKSNAPFDVKKIGAELIVNPVVVEAELEISDFVNVDVAKATFTIVFK